MSDYPQDKIIAMQFVLDAIFPGIKSERLKDDFDRLSAPRFKLVDNDNQIFIITIPRNLIDDYNPDEIKATLSAINWLSQFNLVQLKEDLIINHGIVVNKY